MTDIAIRVDLDKVKRQADATVQALRDLRLQFDLARFEFTRDVRIAPLEFPHSHPVLTLNTRVAGHPDALLAVYLHEQMHWYLAEHRAAETDSALSALNMAYPEAPRAADEPGARDDASVYLHLVINWLEVSALTACLGRARADQVVRCAPVYPWCYATVLRDWDGLEAILAGHGIAPLPDASALVASR